jgi:hexosaminidase
LAWRGLSLDVVRTFVPVDEVKRVIDALSLYKLNVLHLHLTDNEGWRLQIESWPRLTEVGARGACGDRPGGCYTQDEFRDLVAYARDRFVTVVPEIDLPGHAGAALAAYPRLGRASLLDTSSHEVRRFVGDVMKEVAARSPAAFVHIGGDEAFGMDDADHARFVDEAMAVVRGLGKRVVGWQETSRAGVGPDEVVQYWIDFAIDLGAADDAAALTTMGIPPDVRQQLDDHFRVARDDPTRMAEKGCRVLLSPTTHLYLDRPHGDASTRPEQEEQRARLGLPFYPPSSLRAMFEWNPYDTVPGVDPSAIAGIEAALWCETVESMDDLELLLLPRLAGVAEAAWSPAPRAEWAAHRTRLAAHATIWRRAGWSWWHADSVDWRDADVSA